MLRNWAAEADFTTMGAIALLACRQMLCKTCEERRDFSNHQDHDLVYSKRGVAVVIILVWILSLASILPDCLGVTGGYKWSNTSYGCDNVYFDEGERSYGLIANCYFIILVIITSYSIVAWKLRNGRLQNDSTTQHIQMLLRLAITYTICTLPASLLSWRVFDTESLFTYLDLPKLSNKILELSFSCLYWSMYCKFNNFYRTFIMIHPSLFQA